MNIITNFTAYTNIYYKLSTDKFKRQHYTISRKQKKIYMTLVMSFNIKSLSEK